MRATIGLLGLLACGGGGKEASGTATGPDATPSTTTSSRPVTSTPVPVPTASPTDTATDTPTFRYDSSDTGVTGDRVLCADAVLPTVAAPARVPTEELTGCMAGLQRMELAEARTPVGLPQGPWASGSAACASDALSWAVASDPYATVPGEVVLQHWDLAMGARIAELPLTILPPEDQVVTVSSAGICAPEAAYATVSACDGVAYRPSGVSTVSGLAFVGTDPAEVEVRVDWGSAVDELWYWALLPHEGVALGPWPATLEGDDWVGRYAFGDLGLTQADEGVLWGALGCVGGTPDRARIF